MAIHKADDRLMVTLNGSVMKEGRSLNLNKGVFGMFDIQNVSKEGSKAIKSFEGINPNTKIEMRLGVSNMPITKSSGNKSWSSFPFTTKDIVNIAVSKPNSLEQEVDDLIIGYDGINPETSFDISKGQVENYVIRLTGSPLSLFGINTGVLDIPFTMSSEGCKVGGQQCEDCDPCVSEDCGMMTVNAIEFLKQYPISGDKRLTDLVDILPVLECSEKDTNTEVEYKFYCLEKCDTGEAEDLAEVQNQVGKKAVVLGRKGSKTTYQIMQPASEEPPFGFLAKMTDLIKGCEDCPEGYYNQEGGFIYTVTLGDFEGVAVDIIKQLNGVIEDSISFIRSYNDGVKLYMIRTAEKLTDTAIENFSKIKSTAVIDYVGKAEDWCKKDFVEGLDIPWTECGTCKASEKQFSITLPDSKCGNSRVDELKSFYGNNTVEEVADSAKACQRKYTIKVPTNIVCDECDEVFKDLYVAEKPESFEGVAWVGSEQGKLDGCKCGIRFRAKKFEISGDGCLEDKLGFMDSSVRIEATGGFDREVLYGINDFEPKDTKVTYLSRWSPRTNLGGNLREWENESRVFFTGESHKPDYMEKVLTGAESNLKANSQYIIYSITVNRPIMSQGFSGHTVDTVTYSISAEVGKHAELEDLVNSLAVSSGNTIVKA